MGTPQKPKDVKAYGYLAFLKDYLKQAWALVGTALLAFAATIIFLYTSNAAASIMSLLLMATALYASVLEAINLNLKESILLGKAVIEKQDDAIRELIFERGSQCRSGNATTVTTSGKAATKTTDATGANPKDT